MWERFFLTWHVESARCLQRLRDFLVGTEQSGLDSHLERLEAALVFSPRRVMLQMNTAPCI